MTRFFVVPAAIVVVFLAFAAALAEVPAPQARLSERWHGTWKGRLTSMVPGQDYMTLDMELAIHPLDDPSRCTWTIVYIANRERSVRAYEIVTLDEQAGRYAIDEKNSIVIEGRMVGDTLHFPFTLGNVLLLATYRLQGDTLSVDIVTLGTGDAPVTGGRDGAPEVGLPRVSAVQKADLKRE